jgi:hypothetical protein
MFRDRNDIAYFLYFTSVDIFHCNYKMRHIPVLIMPT